MGDPTGSATLSLNLTNTPPTYSLSSGGGSWFEFNGFQVTPTAANQSYALTLSLPSGYNFNSTKPILWPTPPYGSGAFTWAGILPGNLQTPPVSASQCTIPITVQSSSLTYPFLPYYFSSASGNPVQFPPPITLEVSAGSSGSPVSSSATVNVGSPNSTSDLGLSVSVPPTPPTIVTVSGNTITVSSTTGSTVQLTLSLSAVSGTSYSFFNPAVLWDFNPWGFTVGPGGGSSCVVTVSSTSTTQPIKSPFYLYFSDSSGNNYLTDPTITDNPVNYGTGG